MSLVPKSHAAATSSPHRRALLGKVHVAKKQLALSDDDYRAILLRITGRTSSGDCSESELVAVIEDLKSKGFRPLPAAGRRGAARPAVADHPAAKKARALWISLHQLGAIDNPSEQALEAFARRQLNVERLQWANQSQAYKLVEALKAIGDRHGWDQSATGLGAAGTVKVLKLRLCSAILAKLKAKGFAAEPWSLADAAWHLLGETGEFGSPEWWGVERIERLAQGLGRKLRGER